MLVAKAFITCIRLLIKDRPIILIFYLVAMHMLCCTAHNLPIMLKIMLRNLFHSKQYRTTVLLGFVYKC